MLAKESERFLRTIQEADDAVEFYFYRCRVHVGRKAEKFMADKNETLARTGRRERKIASPLRIKHQQRDLTLVQVFPHELESIGSANNLTTLFVALAAFSLSSMVAFGLALTTVTFSPTDSLLFGSLVGLFGLSFFATLLFISFFIYFNRRRYKHINDIIKVRNTVEHKITNKD